MLNEFIAVPLLDPLGRPKEDFTNRSRIPLPASTILVFTGSDERDFGVSNDHTHSRNWRSWPQVLADIEPERFPTGPVSAAHDQGGSNVLYADGHVEEMRGSWLKEEIAAGRNPARPPE